MCSVDVRIIVAGTDLALLERLESRLSQHSYRVGRVASIADLLRQLVHYGPRLVVLVSDHPSRAWDAKKACRRVREVSQALIMVIAHEEQALEMLRAGADDCVARPVDWEEFMARIDALLRRTAERGSPDNEPAILAEAGLWINFDTQEVNLHGKDLVLTHKEFRLLAHLVRNQGQVIPYDRLLAIVGDDDGNTRRASLRQCIHRLRRKIERDPSHPQVIRTHHGIGYAFDARGL